MQRILVDKLTYQKLTANCKCAFFEVKFIIGTSANIGLAKVGVFCFVRYFVLYLKSSLSIEDFCKKVPTFAKPRNVVRHFMRTNDISKITIFLDRNFYKILLISVVTFIIACFVIANRDGNSINKNSKFTIATTVSEWHHKNNSGAGVDYEYIVNDKIYKKTRNVDAKKGDRYLIVFDSINPKRSCLIFFHKIETDCLIIIFHRK